MNNLFLLITDWRIETPKPYGAFHLVSLAIVIALSIVMGMYGAKLKNKPDKCIKFTRIFILCYGIFLVLIETYKQLFFTLTVGHYQWFVFPYQFCSVSMYATIISFFIKNYKVRLAFYKFIAIFGFVAGASVMFYPGDVFTTALTLCIHTMIWHGSQVVIGVFLITSLDVGKSYVKDVLHGAIVFCGFLMIALLLDVIMYNTLFCEGAKYAGDTCNLFYISPYYPCTLPILSVIKEKVPYIIFLFCYVLAFTIGTSFIWGITYLIRKLLSRKHNEKLAN